MPLRSSLFLVSYASKPLSYVGWIKLNEFKFKQGQISNWIWHAAAESIVKIIFIWSKIINATIKFDFRVGKWTPPRSASLFIAQPSSARETGKNHLHTSTQSSVQMFTLFILNLFSICEFIKSFMHVKYSATFIPPICININSSTHTVIDPAVLVHTCRLETATAVYKITLP